MSEKISPDSNDIGYIGDKGNYWSTTASNLSHIKSYNVATFQINEDFSALTGSYRYRSYGYSVRCQKIVPEIGPEPEPGVNLEQAADLSSEGTANSYIVSEAGIYSFPTVKGNSTESVDTVASVEVLWETFGTNVKPLVGDLISTVKYSDGYIVFKASDKKGNASIAAKDSDGNVLWSWHIWMTDQPEDQVYRNNAGTMMDRNLGATSATPGEVEALGLFYQWGRKDPFLGGSSILNTSQQAFSTLTSWPTAVTSDMTYGNIDYARANPTTFIICNRNNYDWLYAEDNTFGAQLWASTKTVDDPCPVGYRIPDGGINGVWETAFESDYFDVEYDATNQGWNFGKSDTSEYLTEEASCWYPAAGSKSMYNGSFGGSIAISGSYWSYKSGSFNQVECFKIFEGNVSLQGSNRGMGYSVRCQKE